MKLAQFDFLKRTGTTVPLLLPEDYLQKACDLMMQHQSPETVCGIVGNIGRDGEHMQVMTLKELRDTKVDMFTTVFIGNSQTMNIQGKMVTPRGYKNV